MECNEECRETRDRTLPVRRMDPDRKGGNVMKSNAWKKRSVTLLLSILLALALLPAVLLSAVFPAAAFAEGAPEAEEELEHTDNFYHFADLSTLERILALDTGEEIWATETDDLEYTIREDLTVPTGKKVFFGTGKVTVEPGVTVTVEEEAALFFYNLDVLGTVVNRGDLVQCSPYEGADDVLLVEGGIVNYDWLMFYHLEGMENIVCLEGGRLFDAARDQTVTAGEPEPSASPGSGSAAQNESSGANLSPGRGLRYLLRRAVWSVRLFFLRHRDLLRTLIPYLVILLAAVFFARAKRKKRDTAGGSGRQGATAGAYAGDAGDMEKRIAHLDDWLKSGLIDREEYRVLKERYQQNLVDRDR